MKKRPFDWKEFWFGYPEFWRPVLMILEIVLAFFFFYYLFLFTKNLADENMINLFLSLIALICAIFISFDYRIYKIEKKIRKNQGRK